MNAKDLHPRTAILKERYRVRLPENLDDLTGPRHGTVQLPGHIAWSGLTAFDVARPPLCISMYQIVLTEGLRDDLAVYRNRGLLIRHWPVLRTVVGRAIRDIREAAFPELTAGGAEPETSTTESSICRRSMGA